MLYAILAIGLVIIIIILTIIISYNKFSFTIIKIEEAENNIDVLFEKKIELLERTRPIIKKELKLEEFLEKINDWDSNNFNHFEINSILKDCSYDLFKLLDENEKLYKSEALVSIIEELNDNEDMIVGSINYYNDSVVEFNKLVVSFPSKLIAVLFRYKKKQFHNNEKREMYEILNEK